ncbi:MAG: hypothetical protein CMQ20_10360 [Gammaproteobacteria bacterium]|jgi:hypothetical protein|nr:hypothetical protein [Gammaproteobacteria bacterium]|tara:strand:- start:395 stop:676 length:282 start_codon:yes stop_codon:yes gene_type:complete
MAALSGISACAPEVDIEAEVSNLTDEGPYGGHSIQWYKVKWNTLTNDQRRWCQQQADKKSIQSCNDADTGWKQGWGDPKTNPPRRWEDGSELD